MNSTPKQRTIPAVKIVHGEVLEPQQMTLAQFSTCSKAERLENHGRKWQVICGARALSFSDADTAEAAVKEAHRAAVHNALYLNMPEAPDLGERPELPPAEVLAEYPDLVAQFPVPGLSWSPRDPAVQELIEAAKPFAELLFDEHPAGTVFNLEVHASDVWRLKHAIAALE